MPQPSASTVSPAEAVPPQHRETVHHPTAAEHQHAVQISAHLDEILEAATQHGASTHAAYPLADLVDQVRALTEEKSLAANRPHLTTPRASSRPVARRRR